MGLFDFKAKKEAKHVSVGVTTRPTRDEDAGVFKAYIPNFLYKPPYGMPRRVNTQRHKELAKNPYVFSVTKTLCDEATSIPWNIQVKEEFQDEGVNHEQHIKEVTKFFNNPNGNEESFQHIMRQLVTDIIENDSGVLVKVFGADHKFKQMFARDGSTFLKNPDIYGYMGDRADFVNPLPDGFTGVAINASGTPTEQQAAMIKNYDVLFKEDAAYFQYGWTAGSMPIPFGKREIVYIMQNPRGDSVYGRSAMQILEEVILNLIYGVDYNLDFFTQNNIPDGIIQLLGADDDQISQLRDHMNHFIRTEDIFGKSKKQFYKIPIASTEVKFTPFQINPKDMEVMAQQQWFTKILWMCFGVNADEMGYTESSNRAVGESQISTFKRKAIRPILDVIEYHLNTQIIPEFFTNGNEAPDFAEVPVEFKFDSYDIDEDQKELAVLEQEIRMGIKTPEMVAIERGIDVEMLSKSKDEAMEQEAEQQDNEEIDFPLRKDEETKDPEEKAVKTPEQELEAWFKSLEENLMRVFE